MFVNKSDVADDGMLAADDNSDMNLSNNDANVTDVYNDTYSVEADSRMFVADAEDNHQEPRSGGNLLQKPLPGFFQVISQFLTLL